MKGIEAIIAERRSGSVPTKLELQERTASLGQNRAAAPTEPSLSETDANALAELVQLSVDDFGKRCDELVQDDEPARQSVEPAVSAACGSSLLDGAFDEAESSASFADALAAWRGAPTVHSVGTNAARPSSARQGLGERLLAKQQLSGMMPPAR